MKIKFTVFVEEFKKKYWSFFKQPQCYFIVPPFRKDIEPKSNGNKNLHP
jgi:hypothetical protein